jgi:hypothetical protein
LVWGGLERGPKELGPARPVTNFLFPVEDIVLIGRLSRHKACMYLWSHARLRPSLLVETYTWS